MSIEMAIWRMTVNGPVKVDFQALQLESRLEDMLVEDPSLIGLDLMVVGRQVATSFGGKIDVLGVDADARLHVLELKRDQTPRDADGRDRTVPSTIDDPANPRRDRRRLVRPPAV